jgi:hypothetical protein
VGRGDGRRGGREGREGEMKGDTPVAERDNSRWESGPTLDDSRRVVGNALATMETYMLMLEDYISLIDVYTPTHTLKCTRTFCQVPICSLVAIFFFGIEELGIQIEEPFRCAAFSLSLVCFLVSWQEGQLWSTTRADNSPGQHLAA